MRRYPTNSPEAMARIVVAVLMADGSLDVSEVDQMERKHITEMIGISAADFEQVLHEYCDDILITGQRSESFERTLDLGVFALLLTEVTDNVMKLRLTSVIIDLISADGDICPHELSMAGYVMANWGAELAGLKKKIPERSRNPEQAAGVV